MHHSFALDFKVGFAEDFGPVTESRHGLCQSKWNMIEPSDVAREENLLW
jgi:hypothetical protein